MVAYYPLRAYQLDLSHIDRGKINALIDTNILIYGMEQREDALRAIDEIDVLYTSAICYMEVMCGVRSDASAAKALHLFNGLRIIPVLHPIEELAIAIRRRSLDKTRASGQPGKAATHLADSLIHATALVHDLPILTNNPDDFQHIDTDILNRFNVVNVSLIRL